MLSVRALMEIPFLFFIVKLRRRFQLRYLIMLAAAFMGVECLLLGLFVTTLPEFVVFAAVFGFGNGLFIGTATNYIYELAPVELRATAHGLFVSVSPDRRHPRPTCSAASCSTQSAASRST